jgi:hypothetical protein
MADLHHLPIQRGAAQLIVSSFGLNASTPKKSLRSIANALRPGEGMLAFQEWATEEDCMRIADETLADHAPDEVPGIDETLRNFFDTAKPWYDDLQYAEDFYEMLKNIGFDLAWVKEARFVTVRLPSLDAFIDYRLAWPTRRLTVAAMGDEQRAAFYSDLRSRLKEYVNPDGTVDWSPSLFRVFALR